MSSRSIIFALLATVAAQLSFAAPAAANDGEIPAFARRYRVSCNLCHAPMPALSEFGETFAGNGFRLAPNEPPRDTIATGDRLLELAAELPLAIRLDAFAQLFTDGEAATDFEMPYNLKILSGGPISGSISYYLYFFLFERGEVGGIEDAFVYFNDIGGAPVDVAVGQFQVSDPLFKRELRLEFQDYAVYRARVGDQPADLTYDRGVMAIAEPAGFTVSGIVVNGNGRGEAEPNRRLDNDVAKNFLLHVTRDVVPGVRLGALGYYGRQEGAEVDSPSVTNRLRMVGGDATLAYGPLEVNAQYLHREDDHPTFASSEPDMQMDGGFVEVLWRPRASRWYGVALYNRVDADRPLLDVRLGDPANVRRYETLTAGAGYLVRRNFRAYAEGTWDLEQEAGRWTLGLTAAF